MGRKKGQGAHWRPWIASALNRRGTTDALNLSDFDVLYDLPAGEADTKKVGAMCTHTIKAGNSLEVYACPVTKLDSGARRERRRRKTSTAQALVNQRNAQLRFMRLAEANFTPRDYVVTLTWANPAEDPGLVNLRDMQRAYDAAGVPWEMEDAHRAWKNYLNRVKRLERKRGGDPKEVKYICVIESGKEPPCGGLPPRYHIHGIIHAPSLLHEEIKALWPFGFERCDRFGKEYDGAMRLARYLTKQKRYERRWSHSRNLKEPVETVSYRKVSRRRAARIAADVMRDGRTILEKLYPGYRIVEGPRVRYSDYAAGAYIYARMYRKPPSDGPKPPPAGLCDHSRERGRGAEKAAPRRISGAGG